MSNREEMTAAMRQVFCQVLEEQMFLFADDAVLADIEFPQEPMVSLTIGYSGFASGGMNLLLPLSLCQEITASVLGVDEDEIPEGADVTDAAKELLNMTCGQFLTAFYGSEPVMNLNVPQAEKLSPAELAELKQKFTGLSFLVDEHPVLLALA